MLFTLRYAPWINVDRINLYSNGEIIDVITVPERYRTSTEPRDISFKRTYIFEEDVFLVAEATGSDSLFPVVTPEEDPPSNISDALDGIVGGLGVGDSFGSGDGITGPGFLQIVTPYALTNPIWLDIDASGFFDAPGPATGPGPAPDGRNCSDPENNEGGSTDTGSGGPSESDDSGNGDPESRAHRIRRLLDPNSTLVGDSPRWDVRKIFQAHQGHAH